MYSYVHEFIISHKCICFQKNPCTYINISTWKYSPYQYCAVSQYMHKLTYIYTSVYTCTQTQKHSHKHGLTHTHTYTHKNTRDTLWGEK